MKRFNSSKVRALGNLQPKSEKEKAFARRSNGIKSRWSVDAMVSSEVKREREFLAPMKADYKPPRLRGRSGTRLSPAKRALVEARLAARKEFFDSLRSV